MRQILALFISFSMVIISGLFFMFASWYLHDNYWEAIPAYSYRSAFVIAIVFSTFFVMDSYFHVNLALEKPLTYMILAFVLAPIFLYFGINYLNNEIFSNLPDLHYGTAVVLACIALPFQFISWFLKSAISELSE